MINWLSRILYYNNGLLVHFLTFLNSGQLRKSRSVTATLCLSPSPDSWHTEKALTASTCISGQGCRAALRNTRKKRRSTLLGSLSLTVCYCPCLAKQHPVVSRERHVLERDLEDNHLKAPKGPETHIWTLASVASSVTAAGQKESRPVSINSNTTLPRLCLRALRSCL